MWRNKHEMDFFKKTTTGHTVVMGRKTFQSIWHALPWRRNVIITTTTDWINNSEGNLAYNLDGITAVESLQKALQLLLIWTPSFKPTPVVFVIGWAMVYKEAIDNGYVDEIILSVVDDDQEWDTHFPRIPEDKYELYRKDYSNNVYWFYTAYYRRIWQSV